MRLPRTGARRAIWNRLVRRVDPVKPAPRWAVLLHCALWPQMSAYLYSFGETEIHKVHYPGGSCFCVTREPDGSLETHVLRMPGT